MGNKIVYFLLEKMSPGSVWHFRLVANPTKSCVSAPGKRGKVHAHVSVPHQKEWRKPVRFTMVFH